MQQRPTHATVDLDAIRANAQLLVKAAAPAQLMAVVKADGYGHGAVPAAQAALAGGATWLGVALVEEGRHLRSNGIDAPILLLSEPPIDAAVETVALGLTPTVYTKEGISALNEAAAASGSTVAVHLKIDTGMRRVGVDPEHALQIAELVQNSPSLSLSGTMTHLAVADESIAGAEQQLERFDAVLTAMRAHGIDPGCCHASNSAGLLSVERGKYDMVRTGIALYGLPPVATELALEPALSLVSRVGFVKRVHADEGISYGWRYHTAHETTIVTVPIGYADGVRRAMWAVGGEVLIRGRRFPIAGTVTMDQLMVDVGNAEVVVGDLVTLLGRDGAERITADDWGSALGTISYEVVSGLSPRVPRRYKEDG